ncbi:cobyric acid synthase [Pseudobacteriovorax antillogorgiicola]|uniref:Cobyric acid synthase n=1 Tax=Pseudobacteriovorax antillogorgiicola TaxID=1513793 RepID=A0A1Y6C1A0_9BACT|nr:cobyric acid synthase [Pseudobacteriovorax antillogorgiicola]TCS50688.1 adenosylcobyric acid synthase (glutamine-hydrolysing) [Pseudobacteriovorax antillogorgiicola]SMF40291.1 adenosylcobyric acid synthase (glutamine-hydrolysing) [Pseudobacteriovorax antillogorgiicola]
MKCPVLMVQGTASSVGKSLLVTGLCRLFKQRGLRVAPFKAQNMALNSYVTPDGAEIGRAQAVQADAAGVTPTATMNPILLKPEGDRWSQVVILGKVHQSMTALDYHRLKPELRQTIGQSLDQLRETHDLVIIEGAGSPAEINLKANDIVNMFVAKQAQAPVLLVGDIDRGGVFASFVGTMELLDADERNLVAGFVINKFRGDKSLLDPGLDFLDDRTGRPSLGVVPYVKNLRLAEEDSIALSERPNFLSDSPRKIDIAIIRLPRISNYDEFDALEHELGVHVAYVSDGQSILDADLLIIPGSKSTSTDLAWLYETELAAAIQERARQQRPIIGICGGCQILGQRVSDPNGIESSIAEIQGLGVLPHETVMERHKLTTQARVKLEQSMFGLDTGQSYRGYEIHLGKLIRHNQAGPIFSIHERNQEDCLVTDGSYQDSVMGTLIHGLFDEDHFRRPILAYLAALKGLTWAGAEALVSRDMEYDRLAKTLEEHLDMHAIDAIIEKQRTT